MSIATCGAKVILRAGWGAWNVTRHPIGGEFVRYDKPLALTITRLYHKPVKGMDAEGETASGERIAFDSQHADEVAT